MVLDERIANEIRQSQQGLLSEGELLPIARLEQYYATFRARFGPERLSGLDGRELLRTMHALDRNHRDSLVYWLEFKNDNEFPAIFGSVSGGSALKYRIYQRAQDGQWMTGSPKKQWPISEDEAIEHARRHRDQLVQASQLLDALPLDSDDEAYRQLQRQIDTVAPDVSDTAWGHKYLSLLHPKKLDDYHVTSYQRFHLIKMLQLPPTGEGRYLSGGRFVAIARKLEMPINHLTTVTNIRHGRPHRYWRLLANLQDPKFRSWEEMRDGSFVAINGWTKLGDLSDVEYSRSSKEKLRTRYEAEYQADGRRWVSELFWFAALVGEGDVVVACENPQRILGIGRVTGPYTFAQSSNVAHRRPVEWLSLEQWEYPFQVASRSPFREIQAPDDMLEIERHIYHPKPQAVPAIVQSKSPSPSPLTGIPARVQQVLERKSQVILFGPPGTGKTYWAEVSARELSARSWFGTTFDALNDNQKRAILGDGTSLGAVRVCTFHPGYSYEDFLEGYRPEPAADQMRFVLRDGIFKKLCADAQPNPDRKFYLIIDEINRGDIPRIFGELLTILEREKRGKQVLLPLSREPFQVPPNIHLIGTMNTADRSIALLDTALRRRFGFIELMPDYSVFGNATVSGIPLGPWLESLNRLVREHVGRDARNLQIGHSYLLERGRPIADFSRFARVLREDIIPLLEEYCYEDYSRLERILGGDLVDVTSQRVRDELFDLARQDDLIRAILAPHADLSASPQAVAADAQAPIEDFDEGETDPSGDTP